MQASVNVIVVEGGVVRDPELKYTADGLAYTKFAVANSGYSKKGDSSDQTSFFDVSAWGKLAEICSTYLKKGKRIIISGKLRQSRWKTPEGQNRSQVQIVAQDVKFLPNQPQKKHS